MTDQIDYTRYYRKFHNDTPEHEEGMIGFYRSRHLPHVPEDRGTPILDVGCGMGFCLLALKRAGYTNLKGVELDPGQAKACVDRGLDVALVKDTTAYLMEHQGEFGAILSLDVLEHIPCAQQLPFAKGICSALKPGGVFIGTVPNANSTLASRWRYGDWTHHSSFTELSLDFLLFNAGFETIKIHEIEFHSRPHRAWMPVRRNHHWWLFRLVRMARRAQMIAELGYEQGRTIPLSLNLLTVAVKPG